MAERPNLFGLQPVLLAAQHRPESLTQVTVARGTQNAQRAAVEKLCRDKSIPLKEVDRKDIDRFFPDEVHQGIVATANPVESASLDRLLSTAPPNATLVVLDGIQDPHNLGAIARSAWALGVHALVLPQDRSAKITPVAIKASSGALMVLPVAIETNIARALQRIKDAGFWIYGAVASEGESLNSVVWEGKVAAVIGNEAEGIRPLVLKNCDVQVSIPMTNPVSLNASAAAAILLYEIVSRRKQA